MRYRTLIAVAAWFLLAGAVFTGLMSWTTTGREHEAWATGTGLLIVPGLTLGIIWALTPRSLRARM